ncbi:MAG: divergent polysaccharide deacetylase family protein, partial [Parvibaculum sedimenti]|uniref:divergent polysaccharide deacetylase family protein n=1 Tax=Parvibaculum sedimenti TaxID=2608632 RepID=UPI003BB5D9E9
DQPSADEQALLEAAKRVEQGDEAAPADGVRIVGAESTSSDDTAPTADTIGPLRHVPDPALVANSAQGPLPVIAKDGRQAWKVYARPLPKGLAEGPRVAIVVSGMGISESATAHAIETLPPEVTLSFAPYGAKLQDWIDKARAAGHEVLLELPMEPFGYPQNDPGPYTLLTNLQPPENISRLEWQMSRFTGYAGVMNYQGARFTSTAAALSPILSALKGRGLMYVDNGTSQRSLVPKLGGEIGLPVAQGTRMVDPVQNPDVIKQSLSMLEDGAKQSGLAVGIASAFPVTVDEVAHWAKGLKAKGVVLVPVTATVGGPK